LVVNLCGGRQSGGELKEVVMEEERGRWGEKGGTSFRPVERVEERKNPSKVGFYRGVGGKEKWNKPWGFLNSKQGRPREK